MFVARFLPTLTAEGLALTPLRLGRGGGAPLHYVMVEAEHEAPFLRCDLYGSGEPECFAFRDVCIWRSWLAIGFGEAVHLVDVDSRRAISIELGCYFGHLYPLDECLLVASSDHLYRFDPDGSVKWRSVQLGLDGVVVERVEGDVVEGSGEWDPPGGWRPFSLSLATGALRSE